MAPTIRERYPPPWHVEQTPGGFKIVSSNGIALAYIYALDRHARSASPNTLTAAEARAIAHAIAHLPDKP